MNTILNIKDYKKVNNVLKVEAIVFFRVTMFLSLLLKTMMFLVLIESSDAGTFKISNLNIRFLMIHAAFIGLLFSFGLLLSQKNQPRFYIFSNIAYSIMLVLDLWYFRANRDFLGLKNIFFSGTFNPMGEYLFRPKIIDILFIIDIIMLIVWMQSRKITTNKDKDIRKAIICFVLSLITIVTSYILLDVVSIGRWDHKLFKAQWSPLMTMRVPGPVGYHSYEAFNTITELMNKSTDTEQNEVEKWLLQNQEQLKENKYKGIFKGKNVIFLQLESFENFVIGKQANQKEITPFLNKLARESLYFNNIFEQNNGGNSIDCDLMVNASVLPLGGSITALTDSEVSYPKSLPRVLKGEGYTTITSHAEAPGEFNWTELHKNGFGVNMLWDISKYRYEETVGYGLSDRSFLSQISDKLKTVPQPFYINAATLSSHGPFKIGKEYRMLNLPKDIDDSYLGGYFESVHYTDRQVEMFMKRLGEEGILENTVVVIYGDHAGVHKYYNEDIQSLEFEGNWWKEYDHRIPLIIYSKGVVPEKFDSYGGQIDIMPTILYLVGVEDSKYRDAVMGRVLVNTQRNATIIKGNIIKGQILYNSEKEHLLNSYYIGEKIIKSTK